MARHRRLGRHPRRARRPDDLVRRIAPRRVRDPRLGHAEGDGPDRGRVRRRAGRRAERRVCRSTGSAARHARAQAGDRRGDREAPRGGVQADGGQGRPRERRDTFHRGHRLRRRAHRLRGGPVRPRHQREGSRLGRRRPGRCPRDGRAGGRDRGVQRRSGVPADRAGNAGAARPARGPDRPADRLPDVRGDFDPARARNHGRRDRVPPPVPPGGADRHQHDHAAARVDDRDRCRHRLLALHRDALPSVPARRHVAGRCGSRGGRVSGSGGALRRPDGRDLGERPRHLRPRLRDEARHRLGARRPHHRPDRELAAHRGAREARPQGRPAEGALPAPDRRFVRGPAEDPDRPLGPVRHQEREDRVPGAARSGARARGNVSPCPPRRIRPGDAAEGADGAQGVRPARRRLRPGLQRPHPDRRGRQRRRAGAPENR